MKKLILLLLVALTIITLLVACGSERTVKSTGTTPNTVRFNGNMFTTSSISIKKGNRITFMNDSNTGATSHILAIGQNGQDESTNGAPNFGGAAGIRLDVGGSWTSPPWTTAGIYHVTCIVHPWMNLRVIVAG